MAYVTDDLDEIVLDELDDDLTVGFYYSDLFPVEGGPPKSGLGDKFYVDQCNFIRHATMERANIASVDISGILPVRMVVKSLCRDTFGPWLFAIRECLENIIKEDIFVRFNLGNPDYFGISVAGATQGGHFHAVLSKGQEYIIIAGGGTYVKVRDDGEGGWINAGGAIAPIGGSINYVTGEWTLILASAIPAGIAMFRGPNFGSVPIGIGITTASKTYRWNFNDVTLNDVTQSGVLDFVPMSHYAPWNGVTIVGAVQSGIANNIGNEGKHRILLQFGNVSVRDNGNGGWVNNGGTNLPIGGTINYNTGAWTITLTSPVTSGLTVTVIHCRLLIQIGDSIIGDKDNDDYGVWPDCGTGELIRVAGDNEVVSGLINYTDGTWTVTFAEPIKADLSINAIWHQANGIEYWMPWNSNIATPPDNPIDNAFWICYINELFYVLEHLCYIESDLEPDGSLQISFPLEIVGYGEVIFAWKTQWLSAGVGGPRPYMYAGIMGETALADISTDPTALIVYHLSRRGKAIITDEPIQFYTVVDPPTYTYEDEYGEHTIDSGVVTLMFPTQGGPKVVVCLYFNELLLTLPFFEGFIPI